MSSEIFSSQRAPARCVAQCLLFLAVALTGGLASAQPLAVLEHHVAGARLRVSPAELYVPKSIPGSLSVELVAVDGSARPELAALGHRTHVEGVLRGPAFPAYRLLGLPNEPLTLPPLPLVGDYQIDDLRLVNTDTGEVLMMAAPHRIAVHVFPEVLVSQVVSRPLSLDEIQARGIVIDASNFSAVEFQAAFVIEGQTVNVLFPVVSPKFVESTEIIPRAELDERLAEAARINRELSATLPLPEALRLPGLNLQLQGLNFERVAPGDENARNLDVPSIPALVLIPGHIGFLNQFFSVRVFTANASPRGSRLSVHSLEAEVILPAGPDQQLGTADDPLALARIGPTGETFARVPVRTVGADGESGTSDDGVRVQPGETAQGELLVEGRRPGLHVFDLRLTGVLDGFAAGEVAIRGRASGSVLVRNPNFSIAFSHPRTIRTGEPYTAAITVLNTSETAANLVSVNLNQASVSGAIFASGQTEQVELGVILPGQSRTAEYHLIAQRTGYVTFTHLNVDDGLTGRFDLRAGVDERGVALSSESIGYPEWVLALPNSIQRAADRVLGQALSVATAATLPAGVRSLDRSIVERRVVELTEAGQRIRYGDAPQRVYLDLLLDWQGGRTPSLGFDEIVRSTDAGQQWAAALSAELATINVSPGATWLATRAADLAGRAELWGVAATSAPLLRASVSANGLATGSGLADLIEAGAYSGTNGWLVPVRAPLGRAGALEVTFTVPAQSAGGEVAWASFDGQGGGRRFSRLVTSDAAVDICYRFFPRERPDELTVDTGCDRTTDGVIAVSWVPIQEAAPTLLSATQDLDVIIGRPNPFCYGPRFTRLGQERGYGNYGTLVAVLFSKPIAAASAEQPGAFGLDNGVQATGVRVQPGGRVALVNLRSGVGTLVPRTLAATGVVDGRGRSLITASALIATEASQGVRLSGRVIGGGGAPVDNIPVTLTMHDAQASAIGCLSLPVRVSQVRTDADGRFSFDFVMAGLGYSIAATDTRGLNAEAVDLLLEASPLGPLDPAELAHLASRPGALAAFLQLFAAADLRGAIAVAEGVDRAELADYVGVTSPRIGSTVPVALRFRGRGTVSGTVLASDGVTPVGNAAVNLFPDVGSREKGRGVFTNTNGRFTFAGVPLGPLTVEATTSTGLRRTVAARLAEPGESLDLQVVLASAVVPEGRLEITVREADGVTAHANAQVYLVRDTGVTALGTANEHGTFVFSNVPARLYEVVATSFDGRQIGRRSGIAVQANATTYASVQLQGTADVVGRVELPNGQPVSGAWVAGGEALVQTDSAGVFQLSGVPVGMRAITAAWTCDPCAAGQRNRLGSAIVNVVPGLVTTAVVRFPSAGRIRGTVRNAAGQIVPNVRVAVPLELGFYWTDADAQGRYVFDHLPLGAYTIAAPAPPLSPLTGDLGAAAHEGIEALQAALTQALTVYASGSAPVYDPGAYGFARTALAFDGEEAVADVRYLPRGTVSGQVQNANGVPIGAAVQLRGLVPSPNGRPGLGTVAQGNSDPASGAFSLSGLMTGDFAVSAASPFYPVPAAHSGQTTLASPNASGVLLQFSAASSGGPITGLVTRDGAPAPADVRVAIGFGGLEVRTQADGTFTSALSLPPGPYSVDVTDPSTGRVAFVVVNVIAGSGAQVVIPLLTATGTLDVTVVQANGSAANGAELTLTRAGRPNSSRNASASPAGTTSFTALMEGTYSVTGCWQSGQTRHCATRITQVGSGSSDLTLTLAGAGTVAGTYMEADGVTPVSFAQVSIGTVAFAVTDTAGAFQVEGVPLGVHRITGHNAVTGRAATAQANLVQFGQIVQVNLLEDLLGDVGGYVIDSDGVTTVPAAIVTLHPQSPIFPTVTVSTDPTGRFTIPGVPPGAFTLTAVSAAEAALTGRATSAMPAPPVHVERDIAFDPRADLWVNVFHADGTPEDATVHMTPLLGSVGTDLLGRARFTRLALGRHTLSAISNVVGRTRSAGLQELTLHAPGEAQAVNLLLPGVGSVAGTLTTAAGVEVPNAIVSLSTYHVVLGSQSVTAFTDNAGAFTFPNVPVGPVRATAISGALAAEARGTVSTNDATLTLDLVLTPSGQVSGVLVRADGVTPVLGRSVRITYAAASGLEGSATSVTSNLGAFSFDAIPEGPFELSAVVPQLDGVLRHLGAVPAGGGNVNVGSVALDEEVPLVLSVTPAHAQVEVDPNVVIQVLFSEAMDPVDEGGVYLTQGTMRVAASITWVPDPLGEHTTLQLTPNAPLAGETTYSLVILAGEHRSATGALLGRGPTDLADRPLAAPWVGQFTTRDSVAPAVVSFTPLDGAEQVAGDAVVRVSFSEPMAPSSIQLSLVGPSGPIAGFTSVVLDRRVAVFTPTGFLPENATFVATLSAATDLAGNSVPGLPVVSTFSTVDTLGPVVTDLAVQGGLTVVTGALLPIAATLAQSEPGVQVQITADLSTYRWSAVGSTVVNMVVPAGPTLTLRARGIDRFGNYGPFYVESFPVAANQPPAVAVTQVTPASGPLLSGQPFSFRVDATDDSRVARIAAQLTGAITAPWSSLGPDPLVVSGTLPASIGPGQSLTLVAEAEDNSGAFTTASPVTFAIADGIAPALSVAVTNSQVSAGQLVSVNVVATDAFGVTLLTFEPVGVAGAADSVNIAPPATTHTEPFSFTVPSSAADGSTIDVVVNAADAAGLIAQQTLTLTVVDVVAPTVLTVAPADGAPDVSVSAFVEVTFSEPVLGVDAASFSVTGGGSAVPGTVLFSPGSSLARFSPSAGLAPLTAHQVQLTGAITDLAGNPLAFAGSSFTTASADQEGPRVVEVRPLDATTGISPAAIIELQLSEAVDLSTIDPSVFQLELTQGGTPFAPVAMTPSSSNTRFTFTLPPQALALGTTYDLRLAPTPTDVAGNPIVDVNGQPFTQLVSTFTTAIAELSIPGTHRVVEGFGTQVELVFEPAATPIQIEWRVDGAVTALTAGGTTVRSVSAPTLAERPSGTLVLGADIWIAGAGRYALPDLVATLEPIGGDADGDGMLNGAEAAAGLNPWVDDAADNPDGDGWTNATELANGTNPFLADTDGDGLADHLDPEPLNGSRPPAIGLLSPFGRLRFTGAQGLTFPAEARLPSPFTAEMWVRPTTGSGAFFSAGPSQALRLAYDLTAAQLTFTLSTTGEGIATYVAPASANVWHHVAVTYDGAVFRAFVDGRIVVSALRTGSITYGANDVLAVEPSFRGDLHEVRVFTSARAFAAIQASMHRALDASEPSLFARWPLDAQSGTVVNDATGRGRHATATSPTWILVGAGGDAPPTLRTDPVAFGGSSRLFVFEVRDLDNPSTLTPRVTRLPQHGRLYLSNSSGNAGAEVTQAPTSLTAVAPTSWLYLLYVVEPGYFGVDDFQVDVLDNVGASAPAVIELDVRAAKTWTGADSAAPQEWSRANNWSPPGAPAIGDSVQIPGGLGAPITLTGPAQAASLALGAGSVIELAGHTLTASGHVVNDGLVQGSGTVRVTGNQAAISGTFSSLTVSGRAQLTGNLRTTTNLTVEVFGAVVVGPHTLTVDQDLVVHGALTMADLASVVDVERDVSFGPNACTSLPTPMSAGELRVARHFTAGPCTNSSGFPGAGTHTVILDGTSPQTVSTPNASATNTRFQNLTIRNVTGVAFATQVEVLGSLVLEPGASVSSASLVRSGSLDLRAGASLTTTHNLEVEGDAFLADNTTLGAGTLGIRGNVTAAPTASRSATTLQVRQSGPIPGGVPFTHLLIDADVSLSQPLSIPGDLTLRGPLGVLRVGAHAVAVGGNLAVPTGRLEMIDPAAQVDVAGNIAFGASNGTCSTQRSLLTAGRLSASGNFQAVNWCGNDFVASGSHLTVLGGAAPSTLNMPFPAANANRFHHLELLGAGVTAQSNVYATGNLTLHTSLTAATRVVHAGGALTVDANAAVTASDLDVVGGLSLGAQTTVTVNTFTVDGNLTQATGSAVTVGGLARIGQLGSALGTFTAQTLSLGAAELLPVGLSFTHLTVTGPVALGRDLQVPGNLSLDRNFSTTDGLLDVGPHTLAVAGNLTLTGVLVMESSASRVDVDGNLTMPFVSCSITQPRLTAGELRLAGNLTQGPSCSGPLFSPGPGHLLILDGTGPQTITLAPAPGSSTASRLGSARIENTIGVSLGSAIVVAADLTLSPSAALSGPYALTVNGALQTASGSDLDVADLVLQGTAPSVSGTLVAGRVVLDGTINTIPSLAYANLELRTPVTAASTLNLGGNLTVDGPNGGALTVGGQTITVAGNLLATGPVHMASAADDLRIAGAVSFTPASCAAGSSNLSQGTLRAGGNLEQSGCATAYAPGPAHRTILNGISPQTTTFAHPTQSGFANLEVTSAANVTLNSNARVTADLLLVGRMVVPVTRTLTIVGALTAQAGAVLDNQGTTTAGSCQLDPAATFTGQPPSCP